jgi:23S rRNA pseudouridine2605 synthase
MRKDFKKNSNNSKGNRRTSEGKSSYNANSKRFTRRGEEENSENKKFEGQERNGFKKKSFSKPKRTVGSKFSVPKKGGTAKSNNLTRINKYLAHSGLGSRREVEKYIASGLVKINGKVVTDLSAKIGPKDVVQFDGRRIKGEIKRYFIMNKPKDFLTTTEDDRGRRTVMELMKNACDERIYPVGRLDRNTTGVLLFTNDGDMSKKLSHPTNGAAKIYYVLLSKAMTQADFERLEEGIQLEDGFIKPDKVSFVEGKKREIGIEIHSGRNRVIRRVFAELGYEIEKLDRVFFAGLTKKNLKRGQWRELTKQEVDFLKMK